MDIVPLIDRIGESPTAALFGLITGILFGVAAQRSRFCLRAATVEFARGMMKDKVAVWLLTFSTAVVWVQGAQLLGYLDTTEARMMAVPGSWSGAIIGGLLFGMGMVLARGCSGRLLVLAATGNLRSVVSGLIFAVVAQMSLTGWLAPLRDKLAALWITGGGRNMDLLAAAHLPREAGLVIGLIIALIALELSRRNNIGWSRLVFASGVGFAAAVGYALTYTLSQSAFDPVQIESLTFTGPSANTLMFFLDRNAALEFDVGLVPGVVIGSMVSAILAKEFTVQGFDGPTPMRNAMIGAVMMGFGGMLAGGCAIGAGVSGGSIFAGTAWLALFCMWIGGMTMDVVMGGRGQPAVV
ncbi:YeeE/YedE family protein [Tropicibacter alexandrii]|uniref:YeeE/YedE family protein n=1 Tax=Tropicibacter alexandrii TaxID=2267683 RepID=UPI000EF48990|nr:YeeE/YedE family protein [Tropicibacter alexandrii]